VGGKRGKLQVGWVGRGLGFVHLFIVFLAAA
jgi:hypothetical protein